MFNLIEIHIAHMVVYQRRVGLHNLRMPTVEEKAAFADRLKFAMRRLSPTLEGGTILAREFNLRYHGEPVSVQTVHKWLSGRTVPKRDKLETLAQWLQVELHWLQYGPATSGSKATPPPLARNEKYPPSSETLQLASKIESLTPHHRYLVEEMVAQFYGDADDK